MAGAALKSLAEAVTSSGLIEEGSRGVALCSGGADSTALLAGLVGSLGAEAVVALHINYALRPDSDLDEATCRELCEGLGIDLQVERPTLEFGNVQAAAREARYSAAEALRARRGLDWIATGHTRHRPSPRRRSTGYATSPGPARAAGSPASEGQG